MNSNLDIIIKRLSFQSTERELVNNYKLTKSDVINRTNKLSDFYNSWDSSRKNKFCKLLGGVVYFDDAKEYIEK